MRAQYTLKLRGRKRRGFPNFVRRMNGPGRGGKVAHTTFTQDYRLFSSTFLITIVGGNGEIWAVLETITQTFGKRPRRVL